MSRFRLLDATTGEAVEVSPEEARQGLAEGRLRAGAPLRVRSIDGRTFEAPADRVGSLLTSGDFDLDTPEAAEDRRLEREYGDRPVAAFGARAAGDLTFGLSDQAAVAIGGEDAQTALRELEQRNPEASIAGSVVGATAPLLLSGGASAVGTAARGAGTAARVLRGIGAPVRGLAALSEGAGAAATRALAGAAPGAARRILSRAAGTAVEGAIEGVAGEAGRIVTEDALGYEPDLAAEAVLSRVGIGGLLGGAAGGTLGAGFATLGEGGRLLRRGGAALADRVSVLRQGWATQVGTELHPDVATAAARVYEAVEAQPGRASLRVDLVADGGPERVLREMMDGSPEGRRILELVANGRARDENVRALRGAVDELLGTAQHVEDFARGSLKRSAVRRRISADAFAEQGAYARGALDRAEQLAVRLQSDPIYVQVGVARGRELAEYVGRVRNQIEGAIEGGADNAADVYIALDQLKRRVGQMQRQAERFDPEATRALQGLYDEMLAPLENAGMWGDDLAEMQRTVNRHWTQYLDRARQWDQMFAAEGGRDVGVDPWRVLREADPAKLDDFLNSAGTARNDRRAEIFEQVIEARSNLARAIAEHMDVPAELAEQARRSPQAVERARQVLGVAVEDSRILNQWREAVAQIGSSRGLSGAISGGLYAGLPGAIVGAAGPDQSVRVLAMLRQAARRVDDRVSGAVRGFLRRGAGATAEAARRGRRAAVLGGATAYRERTRQLEEQARDLPSRIAEGTRDLSGAPRTQQALQTRAARAVAFLQRVRPSGRVPPGTLLAGRAERLPSTSEMERFLRYARAIDDPDTVLADLEAGRLSREGVEALREVYPALYQQITQRAIEALQELKTPPPYQERLQLGLLLGIPTDPSLTPAFLATIQQTHAIASAQQPQQQSAAVTRAPDIAGQLASDTDRLVARRSVT